MADYVIEDILKQKLPGGGNFLLRFFIVAIFLNFRHVTGILFMPKIVTSGCRLWSKLLLINNTNLAVIPLQTMQTQYQYIGRNAYYARET